MFNLHRHSKMVLLMAVVFLSPVFLALIVHQNPHLLGQTTNKGTWLTPPVLIPEAKAGQYSMIYVSGTSCDAHCQSQLEKLAKTRLALGRRLYQVDLLLLLSDETGLSNQQRQKIEALGYQVAMLPKQATLDNRTVYLANPQQQVMLAYPTPLKQNDIFSDIERLLKQAD